MNIVKYLLFRRKNKLELELDILYNKTLYYVDRVMDRVTARGLLDLYPAVKPEGSPQDQGPGGGGYINGAIKRLGVQVTYS